MNSSSGQSKLKMLVEAKRNSLQSPVEFNMQEDSQYEEIKTREDYLRYKKNAGQQVIKCLKYHQQLQKEKGQIVDEIDAQLLTKNISHFYQSIKNSQYVSHYGHIFKLSQLEKHLQVCACAPKQSEKQLLKNKLNQQIEYEIKEDIGRRNKSHTHGPKQLNPEFKKRHERRVKTHQPKEGQQKHFMNFSSPSTYKNNLSQKNSQQEIIKDVQQQQQNQHDQEEENIFKQQQQNIQLQHMKYMEMQQQQQLQQQQQQPVINVNNLQKQKQQQQATDSLNTSFDAFCEINEDIMENKQPIIINRLGINRSSLQHFQSDESMPPIQ